jgi:D-alanyl-D-alanine carboxypeptidase/D-alanyl-D-alanine-endopeptidase (penicillin-binding protein 4)
MVLSLVHFSIWQWLGAFEASVPVSAGERRTANACLEEVFRNVWTILVLSRIFQPEAKSVTKVRICSGSAVFAFVLATSVAFAPLAGAQELPEEPAQRFATRVETILNGEQPAKGEWGILVVDAKSGQLLFAKNADRYFVPASNMKLFTTAFALATLGSDYHFRTTLEAQSAVSPEGKLKGPLFLVGRGDPNLSNRKFPFDGKEEFDGPPEKVVAELADQLVAAGVKDIAGDIVGDDSYFPRERYPSGWEIDDMVWEYGAAVSAIVVNDNTVALTLTPGENAGAAVQADVAPATTDFGVTNLVTTSEAGMKPELTLKR